MSDVFLLIVVFLGGLAVGVVVGVSTQSGVTTADCARLGKFRLGEQVYECSPVKP